MCIRDRPCRVVLRAATTARVPRGGIVVGGSTVVLTQYDKAGTALTTAALTSGTVCGTSSGATSQGRLPLRLWSRCALPRAPTAAAKSESRMP
eukprot:1323328-Rhodomonas_salina.2